MDPDDTGALSLKHCITQGIKHLYQTQQLCDVTLVVNNKRFPCHRTLLASISLYFQRMFVSTFRESWEGEIVLLDLSPASLQSLLDYVYTGELQLQAEQAEELFATASRLQIASALEKLTRFFLERMSVDNCLDLYTLAYSHNHQPLLRPATRYISSHFERLSQRPAFLLLEYSSLLGLIALEGLAVRSELAVYRAVRHWVDHDPAERLPKLRKLMDHVRLPLLAPEELAEVRAETEEQYELVRLPWEELGLEERLWSSRGLRQGMYREGVACVGLPKWSEASLGEDELDSRVHFFDCGSEEWEQLPDLKALTSPSCAALGHKLYVSGGQHLDGSYSDNLLVYDTLGGFWSQLPPMSTPRAWHAFLLCQRKLYVAGGWDATGALVGAESYDLEREEWAAIASLPFALTYFTSAALGGKLYLIGGEKGVSDLPVPHQGVLVYDVASAVWSQVPAALEFCEASAATLGSRIVVVGGLTWDCAHGARRFTQRCLCLLGDGKPDQGNPVPPLPIAISYPGVARCGKRIYVFGGDSMDRYSSAIHYWEPGQPSWTQSAASLPDPNYGAFGFGCVPLKVPRKNILAIFHGGAEPAAEQEVT